MNNQEAIRIIKTIEINNCPINNSVEACEEVRNRFIALEMAVQALEQEPKMGHWIIYPMGRYICVLCSECETEQHTRTNYCPNCGAKMVEPQESEERNVYIQSKKE